MCRQRTGTVREYAEELLKRVSFIDIYGRAVGLDYPLIRELVRERFPNSKMSGHGGNYGVEGFNQDALRYIKCQMVLRGEQLPARRRSRAILARDYTRALVLHRDKHGQGLPMKVVKRRIRRLYPEATLLSIPHVCSLLRRAGFDLPPRAKHQHGKTKGPNRQAT